MNILVTGSSGYVGSHVLASLKKKYSTKNNSYEVLLRSNKKIDSVKNLVFTSTSDEIIAQAAKRADVIIHCAGQIHGSQKEMFDGNINYTKTLVDNAKKDVLFIYMSTENANHDLTDEYTLLKKKCEDIVSKLSNHVILRLNVVYGPSEKKYVARLIRLCKILPVVPVIGNGKNTFQFVFIDDVCSIVNFIIEKNVSYIRSNKSTKKSTLSKKFLGIYTISGPKSFTYNELISAIQKELKTQKPVIRVPVWMFYPVAFIGNIFSNPFLTTSQLKNLKLSRNYDFKKQKNIFKYKEVSLEEGLKKCVKH